MSNVTLRFSIVTAALLMSLPLAAQPGKQKPAAQKPPAVTAPAAPSAPSGTKITSAMLTALKARGIGPAVMSGRVSDIALDPANPFVFYVAMGTSGVMKTSNNGGTFEGIFAEQPVASVGAVAVAPSDPKVVWVGTGEANDRNSSSWGNGVYRSENGGGAWVHAGLADSKTIARIIVHPKDPKTAWVAVMGDLWVPSAERGLYKTTDGGKTWKALLQAPAPYASRVGCGDVAVDPSNPDTVYAALYARMRTPWSFVAGPDATDGKDLGGIFKSTDGGATWKKLEKGLPGQTGRIGLALYAKDPRILYAVVQSAEGGTANIDDVRSKRGGVFRSEDGGESWTRMSPLDPRPFYFSQIRIDPTNDQRVYVLGFMLHVSEDGGRSFREDRFKKVHSDCHALAIDPRNPERLLLGTDGGPYQSFDGGSHWDLLNKFAAGEFYRISTDFGTPYRICGGLQDNSNWVGPSMTWSKEGIINSDWIEVAGGDGFYCVFDETDPNVVYTESQSGELYRFNMKNGEVKPLRPEPPEGQPAFRFHWASPLVPSLHQKGVMYLAGNRVFQLGPRGEQWKTISPDLSARDVNKIMTTGSGAETFGVVYALVESPVKDGLIWAGTDDGKLWITGDGGGSWTDLTPNLPPAVKGQWISRIEAGHFDAQVAYLAVDAHRTGSYAPLAYRTADAGKTWQGIVGGLPSDQPVKVVREDVNNENLLYAGTEFGLFVSFDRGVQWVRYPEFPTVAVDDIAIQPRELDLVVATHGLSLFIVDDIRPLEEMTSEVRSKDAYLFAPRPAFGRNLLPGWAEESGTTVYRGANPPQGAILNVWVKEYTGAEIKVAISNAAGTPVADLRAPGAPGFNRLVWDLKPTKDLLNEYGGEGQKFVRPGEYTVTLTYGKTKQTQKLKVEIAEGLETR
jgi:photosystem II stability/assembly factor-like uncharacterized protein